MHTKRIAVGAGKGIKWKTTPMGAHPNTQSITLNEAIIGLGFADKRREAKKILTTGKVQVDGLKRKDLKYGVGLMDVLTIADVKIYLRALPTKKGLKLVESNEKEAKIKPCKVTGKRIQRGGKIQISLHDGTTLLYDKPVKVNDTVILELPSKKVKEVIPYDVKSHGLIVSGRHRGEHGPIKEYLESTAGRRSLTKIGDIQTLTDYVFVVGKDKPVISL
jgi:small subunit ribosomal protein S4e